MHCYQAFLCYWDGYHLKKYNEPYSAQMVPTDPSGSWTRMAVFNLKLLIVKVGKIGCVWKTPFRKSGHIKL